MGEVRRSENNQGIKLFGATIKLHGEEVKDGKISGKDDPTVENSSEKIIPCPRCKSMETKFCYFNNYNVNQPRHFCKSCQRYWTAGGALRNVPVGAGRRKAKSPCLEASGLPESCLYENPDDDHVFDIEKGLVMDKWNVVTPQSDFRQVIPGKRRRTTLGG